MTDFLFATPGFITGMGMAIDLGCTMTREYNSSRTPQEADRIALYNDWKTVGDDMREAMRLVGTNVAQ